MNQAEAAQIHATVSELWPHADKAVDDDRLLATIGLWQSILGDLDLDVAIVAVKSLMTEGREFPPTVGQIRLRSLALLSATGERPAIPTGIEAWGEISEMIRRRGWMLPPTVEQFSHPVVAEMVDHLGGWRQVCASETGMADRAHFLREFDAVAERHRDHITSPAADLAVNRALGGGDGRELAS